MALSINTNEDRIHYAEDVIDKVEHMAGVNQGEKGGILYTGVNDAPGFDGCQYSFTYILNTLKRWGLFGTLNASLPILDDLPSLWGQLTGMIMNFRDNIKRWGNSVIDVANTGSSSGFSWATLFSPITYGSGVLENIIWNDDGTINIDEVNRQATVCRTRCEQYLEYGSQLYSYISSIREIQASGLGPRFVRYAEDLMSNLTTCVNNTIDTMYKVAAAIEKFGENTSNIEAAVTAGVEAGWEGEQLVFTSIREASEDFGGQASWV